MSGEVELRRARWRGTAGFTLLEAMVYLVFGGMVVAAIHSVVLNSQRDYNEQRALAEGQGVLRNAMSLLVGELRSISAAGGDLLQTDPSLIRMRSNRGESVICGFRTGTNPTYALALVGGVHAAESADSALILAINGAGRDADVWQVLKITQVVITKNNDTGCDWAGSAEPELVVTMTGDTAGVKIGSLVRPFRQLEYGLFNWNGEWWLGRRLRGQTWEPMTGPLLAPADSGLLFSYLAEDGNVAATAADVAAVEILLRAPRPNQSAKVDSLRTKVAVRG
jgi:type II secretory pathway pseudopilin PulG